MISDSSKARSIVFRCHGHGRRAGENNISAATKVMTPTPFAAPPVADATRHTSARGARNERNADADIAPAVGSSSESTRG